MVTTERQSNLSTVHVSFLLLVLTTKNKHNHTLFFGITPFY